MSCLVFFHDWERWSKPKEHTYYQAPNPVHGTAGGDVHGLIQERTCFKCGKYQWRKV